MFGESILWDATKDPDEVKDFAADWTRRLEPGDTITSSVWSLIIIPDVDTALIIGNTEYDSTHTLVWLSGGTVNMMYYLLNRVTTQGGRTLDQTFRLICQSH